MRVKGLRWRDVNLIDRTLTVQRSKTTAGERVIPLNADAIAVVLWLRERAKQLFGDSLSLDWYVLPHAEGKSKPDPTQPMSGWRSAWRRLTRAIECPACSRLQDPGDTCRNEQCRTDIRLGEKLDSGFAFPRSAPSCHHRTCRVANQRRHDYEHRGPRLNEDAGALFPHSTGS